MQPVDIFHRAYRLDNVVFADVAGQWKLHEETVDSGVIVDLGDLSEQVSLGGVLRQLYVARRHAGLRSRALLVAHVDGRGGVLADKDDGKSGRDAVLPLQVRNAGRNLAAYLLRCLYAVDYRGSQVDLPPGWLTLIISAGALGEKLEDSGQYECLIQTEVSQLFEQAHQVSAAMGYIKDFNAVSGRPIEDNVPGSGNRKAAEIRAELGSGNPNKWTLTKPTALVFQQVDKA